MLEEAQIVGWLLHRESTCDECNVNPAECIVTIDNISSLEICRECLPPDHRDSVMDAFWKGLGS